MKLITSLKHWQLFILITGSMIAPAIIGPKWSSITWLACTVILVGWMYSIGFQSNDLLPPPLKKRTWLYHLGFGIALLYGVTTLFGFGLPAPATNNLSPWVSILHLASMAGMFYGLWFTAKQFNTLVRGETVEFLDYSGTFFLIWFAPFGLWFVQPRVNQYLGKESQHA